MVTPLDYDPEKFIILMNEINKTKGTYLHQKDSTLTLTHDRKEKNITTEGIIKIAQICKNKLTIDNKPLQLENLSLSMQNYKSKLNSSKSILSIILEKLFGKKRSLTELDSLIGESGTDSIKRDFLDETMDTHSLKFFYHRAFDDSKIKRDNIEHLNFFESLTTIVDDLIEINCFNENIVSSQLVSDLNFARFMAFCFSKDQPQIDYIVKQIELKLNEGRNALVPVSIGNQSFLCELKKDESGLILINHSSHISLRINDFDPLKEFLAKATLEEANAYLKTQGAVENLQELPENSYDALMGILNEKISPKQYAALRVIITMRAIIQLQLTTLSHGIAFYEARSAISERYATLYQISASTIFEEAMLEFEEGNIKLLYGKHEGLRLFYHKVLDSKERIERLEGAYMTESLSSSILDLIKFSHLDQDHKEIYKRLIDELTFARNFSLKLFEPFEFDKVILECVEKIKNLSNGQSVILPGGTKRHAVLYVIKKQIDGTYSFSIVNTGQAATSFAYSNHRTSHDRIFSKLQLADLDESFINDLFKQLITESKMKHVNQFIMERLHKTSEGISNLTYGKKTKTQRHGSCTVKCVHAYLHNELPELKYRKFKAWMTAQEIKKLEIFEKGFKPKIRFKFEAGFKLEEMFGFETEKYSLKNIFKKLAFGEIIKDHYEYLALKLAIRKMKVQAQEVLKKRNEKYSTEIKKTLF